MTPAPSARTRMPWLTLRAGPWSLRWRIRNVAVTVGLTATVAILVGVALATGDYPTSYRDVIGALTGQGPAATRFIVTTLRLPRALDAVAVGAALGTSGAIFQSLTRNPLGSPDVIGFGNGAATGALIAIVWAHAGPAAVALSAIAGGVLTATAVLALVRGHARSGHRLILTGIGVSALLYAANSWILVRARLEDAAIAQVWLIGSLNGRGWEHAIPVGCAVGLLLPLAAGYGSRLTVLSLGDDAATALGVGVERTRVALVMIAVALVAVATASAGPIAFVALAAPHVAARITRPGGNGLLLAALTGSVLLCGADIVAQRLIAGTQLPVGVLTGLMGGVFLLWLLSAGRRRGG